MASLNYICIIKQYYKYNDSNEKEDTMKKKWLVIAAVFLMGMMITGCKKTDDSPKNADKLDIITTFYPMYDFTSKIVGNEANVTMLIDSDVEPHDYEPSAKKTWHEFKMPMCLFIIQKKWSHGYRVYLIL